MIVMMMIDVSDDADSGDDDSDDDDYVQINSLYPPSVDDLLTSITTLSDTTCRRE